MRISDWSSDVCSSDLSDQRGRVELAGWDEERGLIKVSPLFDWSREEVVRFTEAARVPVNPLHAQGFLSIGCEPCTRAVKPGEPERAELGRAACREGVCQSV